MSRQRRLFAITVGITASVIILIGLAGVAIRNDRVVFEYYQEKGQRELLEQLNGSLNTILKEERQNLFQSLNPLAELLTDSEQRTRLGHFRPRLDETIEGVFCLDARHQLLFPRTAWPYRHGQPQTQDLSALSTLASQSRAQALVASVVRNNSLPLSEQQLQLIRSAAQFPESSLEHRTLMLATVRLDLANSNKANAATTLNRLYSQTNYGRSELGETEAQIALRLASVSNPTSSKVILEKLLDGLMSCRFNNLSRTEFYKTWSAARGQVRSIQRLPNSDVRFQASWLVTLTTFEQDLKWLEDLSIQLKSYLDQLSADPSPTGERTRRITSSADEPLLIYYRPLSIDGGASHAFIGYKVDLERFAHKVIAPRLFKIKAPEGLGYMVVDHKGQIIADSGDQRLLRSESSPTLSLRPEALPFWRIIVRRDPSAVAGPALFRTAVLLGIILIAIAGLIFGGFAMYRYVSKSLELAQMKADFVSSITHELKTPLTSIQMFSELLSLGRVKTDEKRQQYYEYIKSESIRLRVMIDDILQFAKSESGKVQYHKEETDLPDIMRDALEKFQLRAEATGFDVTVTLPESGELPPAAIDQESMVRVFINLLSNAVKYSLDDKRIVFAARREGAYVVGWVQDHGVGIAPENHDKVFEKFFRAGDSHTREVSGTGLGLALCKSIVKAHDGKLTLESEKEKGSTFTVWLPIIKDYQQQWPPILDDAEQIHESEQPSDEEQADEEQADGEQAESSASAPQPDTSEPEQSSDSDSTIENTETPDSPEPEESGDQDKEQKAEQKAEHQASTAETSEAQ